MKIETHFLDTSISVYWLLALLVVHVWATRNRQPNSDRVWLALSTFLLVSNLAFVGLTVWGARMDLGSALLVVGAVSVCTFVTLGELMMRGLARKLTEWRGEKCVKELDYIYLTLGASGLVAAINRIESVSGRVQGYEVLGATVLGIAIAIRFIKTRAEVEGWNKLDGA